MRIKYDSDADILFIILRDHPPVDAIEEPKGIVISYGEDGEPVSVEFLNAMAHQLISLGKMSVTLETPLTSLSQVV